MYQKSRLDKSGEKCRLEAQLALIFLIRPGAGLSQQLFILYLISALCTR